MSAISCFRCDQPIDGPRAYRDTRTGYGHGLEGPYHQTCLDSLTPTRAVVQERSCVLCGGIEQTLSDGIHACDNCGHTNDPAAPTRPYQSRWKDTV